jgi:hypothetical protein
MLGGSIEKDHPLHYEFTVLTFALTLGKGMGFGELALMAT